MGLSAAELKDPNKWLGQSAEGILKAVRQANGWITLFPDGVPMWLHKIRNYFNVEPATLRLVDKGTTAHWMGDIRKYCQLNAFIKGPRTLSGHVYFDEEVEVWYQMGAGGTIYHWGRDVIGWLDWAEAGVAHFVRGQPGIPIFKLVCPDGTGGSKETIIKNPKLDKVKISTWQGDHFEMQRRSKIAETNEVTMVKPRIITNAHHQGSYNFSETAVNGLDSHEKYDVEPHHKDAVYVDPPDRHAPLQNRIFKEWFLAKAGAKTKMASDFDEPTMRHSPHGVSRSGI
ncbi:MAG: hypothetical protein ABL984_15560 [Pyrinomonadaceae bacterium]